MSEWFSKVGVVGAGTMGQGIAQVCATVGLDVRLHDVSDAQRDAALSAIQGRLSRAEQKGRIGEGESATVMKRIEGVGALAELAECDLLIEAVPERMELKRAIFAKLVELAGPDALLATNTSSLSVTEIAAASGAPDRVLGLHFFNPVPRMELVELVRAESTAGEILERGLAFVARLGKEPIVVRDWPGFATSRLGIILCAEAVRMLEQGVASAADIDKAMELGYRHPMGPLRLTDLVGLDVRLSIMEHLHRELGEAFRPPPLLRQMVRAGKLGRKTGEGFYRYGEGEG